MNEVGRWTRWYSLLGEDPEPYADTVTYKLGADFLADCKTVEDWGSGKGWFSTFIEAGRYRGIDGSESKFADEVVDLATYTSSTEGLFMRHVLEHSYRWEQILNNAIASFSKRMVLVIFTPFAEETQVIALNSEPEVPDISFRREDITNCFKDCDWSSEDLFTPTQYSTESIFFISKQVDQNTLSKEQT